LVSIFKDGKVLELNQPDRDVALTHKEASEEHEGHNQDGSQCHSKLFISKESRDDQGITSSSIVDQEYNEKEQGEGKAVNSAEPNREVNDSSENHWGQNSYGELTGDLSEEVGSHTIHIVVHFSQEHGSFIGEDQNNVLNSIESHGHASEEEGSVSVLNSLDGPVNIVEEHNSEEGSQDGHDQLNIRGLWESHHVQEVSL
jgi:hypothetical protein